jgi:hypothetical protein
MVSIEDGRITINGPYSFDTHHQLDISVFAPRSIYAITAEAIIKDYITTPSSSEIILVKDLRAGDVIFATYTIVVEGISEKALVSAWVRLNENPYRLISDKSFVFHAQIVDNPDGLIRCLEYGDDTPMICRQRFTDLEPPPPATEDILWWEALRDGRTIVPKEGEPFVIKNGGPCGDPAKLYLFGYNQTYMVNPDGLVSVKMEREP